MLVIRIDGGGRGAQTTKTSFSDPKGGEGVGGVTLGNSRGEEGPHTDPPRWEKEGGGRSGRVVVIAIIPPISTADALGRAFAKVWCCGET